MVEPKWMGCISDNQNRMGNGTEKMTEITKTFSEEEIKAAMWTLGSDKASGHDDFPIFFYRKFWDIVKPDIIRLMESLFEGTLQLDWLNYAHVVLISEKGETKD